MFQSNKLLALSYILCFLALALSSLAIAQPKPVAKKAEYIVTKDGQSSLMTVWFSTDMIAFTEEGSSKVALWRLWQTQHPSFYQAYPEVGYRIEFDRLASHSTKKVLEQLKSVVNDGDFKDAFVIDGKQFKLSSLENGWGVEEHMNQWNDFCLTKCANTG